MILPTSQEGGIKQRDTFLSSMAEERGVDVSRQSYLDAEANGLLDDLFDTHGNRGSQGLPIIGASRDIDLAEYFARGPKQTQAGHVTIFKMKTDDFNKLAERNYENRRDVFDVNPDIGKPEQEYLFNTQIDSKYVVGQYRVAINSSNLDLLHQSGKLEIDQFGFYRAPDLGSHSSIAELMQSGALPGTKGVTVTDRTVRFGDVYELGTLDGRKIEFALTTERIDGQLVKRLYSGDAWTTPIPKDSRIIGHVHPNETATQMWPSAEDMNVVNARLFRELQANPNAQPKPTRIFWGTGNTENTIFYPGFGKAPK